jgi:Gas vesicle synthesis protein GvpO
MAERRRRPVRDADADAVDDETERDEAEGDQAELDEAEGDQAEHDRPARGRSPRGRPTRSRSTRGRSEHNETAHNGSSRDESERDESGHDGAGSGERRLSAADAGRAGLKQIIELTGKHPESVTGVRRSDEGWLVTVEVIEDRRVPSSTDILSTYETEIDGHGELLSYRRVRRYSRGHGDDGDS